jgi:hypothetical protein
LWSVSVAQLNSEKLQFMHLACGNDAMRRAAVFKWWNRFGDGENNTKFQIHLFHYPEIRGKRSTVRFREVGGAL